MKRTRAFFVMLNTSDPKIITPLMESGDEELYTEEVAMFKTYSEAQKCGTQNPMGYSYGFEIFESTWRS